MAFKKIICPSKASWKWKNCLFSYVQGHVPLPWLRVDEFSKNYPISWHPTTFTLHPAKLTYINVISYMLNKIPQWIIRVNQLLTGFPIQTLQDCVLRISATGFRIRTSKKVASEYLSEYQSTLPETNMALEQMLYKRCLGKQDTWKTSYLSSPGISSMAS